MLGVSDELDRLDSGPFGTQLAKPVGDVGPALWHDEPDSYEHSWQLVEWLQAKHVLCVAVDASLRASYGYTCPACMPQVAHEEQEPQAEVGS